jgi:clan AA aspartic protease
LSGLLGLTPVVRLRLENVLLGRSFPTKGFVEGVIDTGYQGFIAIPGSVFTSLSLPKQRTVGRNVQLADGTKLRSDVGHGTAFVAGLGVEVDGPMETIPGLAEVLVGTQFLSRFRLDLDYCLRRTSLAHCG